MDPSTPNEVDPSTPNEERNTSNKPIPSAADPTGAWTAGGNLDKDDFLQRWFSHQEKWSVEDIWRFILNGGSRDVNKDVNSFLPLRIPVKEWCESLRCEISSLRFSVKEFVYKTSSILYVDEAGKKAKSFAKQNLVMISRFYSFCADTLCLMGKNFDLNDDFCKYIQEENFLLGFFLQVLRHDRTEKTISAYRDSLCKMTQFLEKGKFIADSRTFYDVSSTLNMILSGRKVVDKKQLIQKNIQKTKLVEEFDPKKLAEIISVERIGMAVDQFSRVDSVVLLEGKQKFFRAQGAVALLFRSMNASHLIDIQDLTCDVVEAGLKQRHGPTIIFEPNLRFKNSHSKNVIFRLSIPVRFCRVLSEYVTARRKLPFDHPFLFSNSKGKPASAANISNSITAYLKSEGVKDIGANNFRHMIETLAQNALEQAKKDSVLLQTAETNRESLHGGLLHTPETAHRYYVHSTDKQSAFRSQFIDTACFQSASTSRDAGDDVDEEDSVKIVSESNDPSSSVCDREVSIPREVGVSGGEGTSNVRTSLVSTSDVGTTDGNPDAGTPDVDTPDVGTPSIGIPNSVTPIDETGTAGKRSVLSGLRDPSKIHGDCPDGVRANEDAAVGGESPSKNSPSIFLAERRPSALDGRPHQDSSMDSPGNDSKNFYFHDRSLSIHNLF